MLKTKIFIILGIAVTFALLFGMAHGHPPEELEHSSHLEYNTARILSILADNTTLPEEGINFYGDAPHVRRGTVTYEIEVLRGAFAGQILEANYHMSSPSHIFFESGDRVSVRIFEFEGEIMIAEIRTPERTELIFILIGVFLLFLCAIGGKRGILAVLGLVFTLICVLFLLIPLITSGYPVIFMTLIVLALVAVASITLLAGISSKGISAIFGCLSGILLSALFAYVAGNLLHISGYHMANYRAITHLTNGAQVGGLFISSVLVASIGAIMDASMSVASAMEEIFLANPHMTKKQLFQGGFNVSRDVMGTMSTTLILAFIGGSLALMIFMYTTNVNFNQFMNNDLITMEIIKGIAGSFGIVLSAPLTALFGAKMLTNKER